MAAIVVCMMVGAVAGLLIRSRWAIVLAPAGFAEDAARCSCGQFNLNLHSNEKE